MNIHDIFVIKVHVPTYLPARNVKSCICFDFTKKEFFVKSKQILKSSFFRETYLQGILGWDDQSQMISEAESPFSSTATSGLFKWFMYTAFNSSSKEDANSGFGVFGGDLGLKKNKI